MKVSMVLGLLFLLASFSTAQDKEWKIEGIGVSTDNCVIGCPCLLGEAPTHGRCQFADIMLIQKGHYGDVNLDNTKIAVGGAFGRSKEMGKEETDFVTVYIDASASKEQKDALRKIIDSPVFTSMGKPSAVKEVPISLTGLEGFAQVGKTYGGTIGDIAKIQITPASGNKQNQPIVVENTADPLINWTALGQSVNSYYKDAGVDWTFNGTSGESQRFSLSSSDMSDMNMGNMENKNNMDNMEHH